jgi:FixJ family two-component response regulator
VPVVVFSGYGDVVNQDIMTRLGVSAVLTKPLSQIEILPATIRAILG